MEALNQRLRRIKLISYDEILELTEEYLEELKQEQQDTSEEDV